MRSSSALTRVLRPVGGGGGLCYDRRMDSDDTQTTETAAAPARSAGAERVRRHRRRRQKIEQQIAFGIAKIVTGRGAGEQRKALLGVLEKASRDKNLPHDIMTVIDEAIDKLSARGGL